MSIVVQGHKNMVSLIFGKSVMYTTMNCSDLGSTCMLVMKIEAIQELAKRVTDGTGVSCME